MSAAEEIVLCGANSYEQKYYLNPDFQKLPEEVRQELQIMCVTFTEEAGGILLVKFDPEGDLKLETMAHEDDYLYDEIEAGIQIGRLQREKEELFQKLELYFKAVHKLI